MARSASPPLGRLIAWSLIALVSGVILGAAAVLLIQSRAAPAPEGDPVAVTIPARNAPRVEALLEGAAWTSSGPRGSVLWVVGGRQSPDLGRFVRERAPRLAAEGVEVRYIPVALPAAGAADRAVVAELWLNRDLTFYRRWIDGVAAPPATSDLFRDAVAQAARAFSADLAAALDRAETDQALVVWRDGSGALQVCTCAAADRWRPPSGATTAPTPAPAPPSSPQTPAFGAAPLPRSPPGGLPAQAPELPTNSAPVDRLFPRDAQPRPAPPRAAGSPRAETSPPARPAPPRGEPEAKRDEDSLFF